MKKSTDTTMKVIKSNYYLNEYSGFWKSDFRLKLPDGTKLDCYCDFVVRDCERDFRLRGEGKKIKVEHWNVKVQLAKNNIEITNGMLLTKVGDELHKLITAEMLARKEALQESRIRAEAKMKSKEEKRIKTEEKLLALIS